MKKLKKLTLNRETLRDLKSESLGIVDGGVTAGACYPTMVCTGLCQTRNC
jgi:hypothetical protein